MIITSVDIYKFSIPMHPFSIATGTMHYAQNIFLKVRTDAHLYGVGECSAFPVIVGETQATCFEMAKDFAAVWIGKNPLQIKERMNELHSVAAYNPTIKSAFDMALYDLAAKNAHLPLYKFLGGKLKPLQTDLTIGIDTPENMAAKAVEFINCGVKILKVKLGKNATEDVERIKQIRKKIGTGIKMRIDANQGWSFDDAKFMLHALAAFDIEFCEQPMHRNDDNNLPELKKHSSIPIMADESVFDHHDATRLIAAGACSFINIKMAKSGGILEALKINEVCAANNIPCMMGGMLESRIALSAFAHTALACDNIIYYDMDTCMLGHKADPVTDGVTFNNFYVNVPALPGIGADADETFLKNCEKFTIK